MTFKPISNPELYQCNHIDGNKSNNNIDNLEWCTCSENANHAFKIGLRKSLKGKDHHFYGRIFTDEEKKNLSEKLKGEKHPFYGKQFSNETKNKMSENHVDVKGENNSAHKLVELEVIEVRKLLKEKILTQKEIAKMFNIIQSTVSGIKLRKTWSHIKEEEDDNDEDE
jgi:predicted XRE-type DNA-binding protein